MSQREIVLCAPVRTAIGTYGGTLKDMPAPELGAAAIRETLKRAGVAGDDVETLVMGNVIQAGVKMNPARQAGVKGGLPVAVPALTVNRVCGSGAQAIVTAAAEIGLGLIDTAVAGGMENMDRAPYLLTEGRWGYRMGHSPVFDALLYDGLNDAFSDEHSGWHTEDLVTKHQITREDQDRWALRSQQRFSAAQAAGKFDAEIAAVEVKTRKGPVAFAKDEHNRPDTTAESLAKLKPAFRKDGTITAGNAPGLNTRGGGDGRRRAGLGGSPWCAADGAARQLGYGRRRARHVRHRAGPGRPTRRWNGRAGPSAMWSGSRSTRPLPPSRSRACGSLASRTRSPTSRAARSPTGTPSAQPVPC